MAIHATRASSFFSITVPAEHNLAVFAIRSIAMPANGSNSDTYELYDNIRRSADHCETFSCEKSLAFAHIATTRFSITSVLKLAHFIRSDSHNMGDSSDLSKHLSLDHSAGRANSRNIAIRSIAMPANDSNSDMYRL